MDRGDNNRERRGSWREVEPFFRNSYLGAPAYVSGRDWAYYAAAYRFGWEQAHDSRLGDRTWDEVEPQLEQRWRRHYRRPWRGVRAAVREAWERATRGLARNDAASGIVWTPQRPTLLGAGRPRHRTEDDSSN